MYKQLCTSPASVHHSFCLPFLQASDEDMNRWFAQAPWEPKVYPDDFDFVIEPKGVKRYYDHRNAYDERVGPNPYANVPKKFRPKAKKVRPEELTPNEQAWKEFDTLNPPQKGEEGEFQ